MRTRSLAVLLRCRRSAAVLLFGVAFAACGGVTVDHQTAGATGAGGAVTSASVASGNGGSASAGTSVASVAASSSSSGGLPPCDSAPDEDKDHDGFTAGQGDCNDCDPDINPDAVEIIVSGPIPGGDGGIPAPVDDDCDGLIDNVAPLCDTGLDLADADPLAAAHAIDLCKLSTGPDSWGLVSAAWVLADGAPLPTDPTELANYHLGHGILSSFGPNNTPKAGKSLLVLSTGTARRPTDPGYQSVAGFDKGFASGAPPNFPLDAQPWAPSNPCFGVASGGPRDAVAIDIHLRAPTNVVGFQLDFSLFSRSWPERVCSAYDDQFVVLQSPAPMGALFGDIVFDEQSHALTLNEMLPGACSCAAPPCFAPPAGSMQKPYECKSGSASLLGTGFEGSAGTGWLETRAPVKPGEDVSLRFTLWDGEDGLFDTTVLIDAFHWLPHVNPVSKGLPPAD